METKVLKSKALEIIRTFTKEEQKNFALFLSSSYFNTNRNIIKLYEIIIKNESRIFAPGMSEKEIYKKIFNTDKFSSGTLRNLMSTLYGLCDEFLITEADKNYPEHKFENELKLLTQYSKRQLDKHYELRYQKVDKELEYYQLGTKYFEKKHSLVLNLYNYQWRRGEYLEGREILYIKGQYDICKVISIISEEITTFDYIENTLNFIPPVNPLKILFKNINLKNFLEGVKEIDEVQYHHISNELKFIKLVIFPEDKKNYTELKKIIFDNISKFSNVEKSYITMRLLNYITYRFDKGELNLIDEIAEIRSFQLKNIKYGEENVDAMQMHIFINIVDIFIKNDRTDSVEDLIKDHIHIVEKVNRDNAYNYAMARLELVKKNFEKALEYLSKLEMVNHLLKFPTKMLMIQTYYELGYYESGFATIDALKHFMKRDNNFFRNVKERYTSLLKITEKIYRIKSEPGRYSLYEIEKIILELPLVTTQKSTWYYDKLIELKKDFSGGKRNK
ncbi:MAG: hypothetical protein ABI528_00970 [bacterium]